MNTVIFDIGNVLAAWDWKGYLQTFGFDRNTCETLARAVFLSEAWTEGDAGIYTPKEWECSFYRNAPGFETEITKVLASIEECIYPYDYVQDWIAFYRKKGFRIFYLSNYSEGLYVRTKERLSFIENMDGGIFSFEEKCIKPDLQIYKLLLNRYNIEPKDAIFYDDSPVNVEAAKSLGIQGIIFRPGMAWKAMNDHT